MRRIFSNGPEGDYVRNPLDRLIAGGAQFQFASPYFNATAPVESVSAAGKPLHLLIGLNEATRPDAVAKARRAPGVAVRYLTGRFHAKIYLSDRAALVGSSNLTSAGLEGNREGVLLLDRPEDFDAVEQLRAVFQNLWDSAPSLTDAVFERFERSWLGTRQPGPTRDELIAEAVGKAEPATILVGSAQKSRHRLFLDTLHRQIYEQYRPAFDEITSILVEQNLRRLELEGVGLANETNRFLNWVRLTHAPGEAAWAQASMRAPEMRRVEVMRLGEEWAATADSKVPAVYIPWLDNVRRVFGDREELSHASRESLTDGLMSLHAFTEQQRHVLGGEKALPAHFWSVNGNDVARVRSSILELVHGAGDFAERLHDFLYDPKRKVQHIGRFTALELYGTVRPDDCPPVNGRMAKALRYLGYDVLAA